MVPAASRSCDQTCSWCARQFWAWVARRMRAAERQSGRSGGGSFADVVVTSVHADRQAVNHEPNVIDNGTAAGSSTQPQPAADSEPHSPTTVGAPA